MLPAPLEPRSSWLGTLVLTCCQALMYCMTLFALLVYALTVCRAFFSHSPSPVGIPHGLSPLRVTVLSTSRMPSHLSFFKGLHAFLMKTIHSFPRPHPHLAIVPYDCPRADDASDCGWEIFSAPSHPSQAHTRESAIPCTGVRSIRPSHTSLMLCGVRDPYPILSTKSSKIV
jgi:hypothetical protein